MAEFNMDRFEQDYRNERREALRDSVQSGKTSLPIGILQHGANRIGEGVSDTVQGIGAFAKSLYSNPQSAAESGAEGLEALYNRVAQEDPMAAMQVAQMVASGGTGAAILRGGRIDPSAVGSGGGNIIRGFHSTRKDFDEIDPERGLPTGNFGQAAYFSESNDYPSRLNPNSRIIEADLDTTDFLQAGKKIPVAKERVLGTLSVLNSLEDATGKPFKVEYDADTNTALVEYNRRRRAGEEGPIKETKTFDFNNSSKLFDDIKSVTWGLRYESMSTDRTNLSDFMRAAGFTGVKGGSDDDFHIGVFDKSAVKQFAQGGPVMRGIGTLNETARNMFRGPRGIGAYQQFADGGPVYMSNGGEGSVGAAYKDIINKYAEEFLVNPDVLFNLLKTESNFDPKAVNKASGAQGIAQVMPDTAADPGYDVTPLSNPFNAEDSIRFSAEYLSAMLEEFRGDYDLALAAYNAGPGRVRTYRGVPPFAETQNYIEKILGRVAPDEKQGRSGSGVNEQGEQVFTPRPLLRGETGYREELEGMPLKPRMRPSSLSQGIMAAQDTVDPAVIDRVVEQVQEELPPTQEERDLYEKYRPENMFPDAGLTEGEMIRRERFAPKEGDAEPYRQPRSMEETIQEYFDNFKPSRKPERVIQPKPTPMQYRSA